MKIRRRDLVQLGAGAGAGLALSPVPWKLLDDSAIWSQNWSWLPKVPRGERTQKQSRCTLCPGGCAVSAECIGGVPVYLKGAEGPLCALGLGGHHLAYHPERLQNPTMPVETAAARIGEAAGKGRTVILDQRPGRAISEMYRRFAAALPDATYVPLPSRDGATLRAMERLAGVAPQSLGVDFEKLSMVVGVGTPLLDGWPEQSRIVARRRVGDGFRLIQVESRQSATATGADEWVPARTGQEVREALALAARLKNAGPALVIADGDPGGGGFDPAEMDAIAGLNLTIAGPALTSRRKLPWAAGESNALDAAEDRSVQLLILGDVSNGDAIPWSPIERKLAPGALIVSFSPYLDALTRRAHIVVPAPAAYEAAEDVLAAPYATDVAYAIAAPLHPKPLGGTPVAETLKRIAPALEGSPEEIMKERAAALESVAASKGLPRLKQSGSVAPGASETPALAVVSFGWRGSNGAGLSSPLVTKLYQESGLRPGSLLARMHPDTARQFGLANRDRVAMECCGSTREKTVCLDSAVLPGVVEIADSAIGRRWAPAGLRRIS